MVKRDKKTASLQAHISRAPLKNRMFILGPAGAGKTTAGVNRLHQLLSWRIAPSSILVMTPQRTLAVPYQAYLRQPDLPAGSTVNVVTMGGLARRMVDLFWPYVVEAYPFGRPDQPPSFLTLESAQYVMARVARPLLEAGYFESVVADRNRLYSQVLDNLNKAALVGFPYTEIGPRLNAAWTGETAQTIIYDQAQACATNFRQYCLEHNLLDFSLQLEIFVNTLWNLSECRSYLTQQYTHLIVDNLEEDTPVAHDILREWLPQTRSSLFIYDTDAGYRRFLGADPQTAESLQALCDEVIPFEKSLIPSDEMRSFGTHLADALHQMPADLDVKGDARKAIGYAPQRFHPEMIEWVCQQIHTLIHDQGIAPSEIVVLSPFMSDSLRFSLTSRMEQMDIPWRTHRPSRSLRDEPATRCLLTLAMLAHPEWNMSPSRYDVKDALMQAIDGLDLVRASLLCEIVYTRGALNSFDAIKPEMQERITYTAGNRYEILRQWLENYTASDRVELDVFFSRLFGEVLSQPGFGYHTQLDRGTITANLIESVQKFRWAVGEFLPLSEGPLGQEYVRMVQEGVVAAQYLRSWDEPVQDAVLLAPAHTFLMRNEAVSYQFWLNVGSQNWSERILQPLTHPYVLSREWEPGRHWTGLEEQQASIQNLYRLCLGLIRRCRKQIFLGLSELGEQGMEQQSLLLQAIQQVLRQSMTENNGEDAHV
jgi:hypothetical protein